MEIDIIELLRLVKEGKAPKKIKVNGITYEYSIYKVPYEYWYYREKEDDKKSSLSLDFTLYDLLDMKIKILDKPIIEEIQPIISGTTLGETHYIMQKIVGKINEIIRQINNSKE